jgi:hypothetical protein
MKYLLLIYMAQNAMSESDREHCYAESTRLAHDLEAKGQYLSANPLHPVSTATSVRVRDGKRVVTDGPFAETREHLGGYFLIDAGDLDEAIGIAARIPAARVGTVEVRPVLEIAGLPGGS